MLRLYSSQVWRSIRATWQEKKENVLTFGECRHKIKFCNFMIFVLVLFQISCCIFMVYSHNIVTWGYITLFLSLLFYIILHHKEEMNTVHSLLENQKLYNYFTLCNALLFSIHCWPAMLPALCLKLWFIKTGIISHQFFFFLLTSLLGVVTGSLTPPPFQHPRAMLSLETDVKLLSVWCEVTL